MRPPPTTGLLAGLLTGVLAAVAVPAGSVAPAAAAPAAAPRPAVTAAAPLAPTDVWASTLGTAITVTWQQPRTGPAARSFRVYEGDQVVARETTTSTTLYVPFGTSHTYTVTAVDGQGLESTRSAPATGRSWLSGVNPECLPSVQLPITVTAVSASAVSLSWPRHPLGGDLELRVNGTSLGWTPLTSARVGGLAPGRTHSVALYRYQRCGSTTSVLVGSASVSTPSGPAARPGAPSALTVTGRTDSTVRLSWTAPGASTGSRPARYAVYSGGTLLTVSRTTSVTVDRLYHATTHRFTVAALDSAGSESAHSPAASAATEPCLAVPPRPVGLTAVALSPSSVRLDWVFEAAATSYTVYDGTRAVATSAYPEVVVSGLPSASRHEYRVSATLPQSCGVSPQGDPATVTTPPGPAGRPTAPATLEVTGNTPTGGSTTQITLAWSASAGGEPAVGYRVYEGATVVGETPSTSLALTVGAATRHSYTVVAVDAAGNESAASPSVSVQAMFLPPP